MAVSPDPLVWIAAILILGEYSVFVKDTDWGRWTEATLIGAMGGHYVITNYALLRGYWDSMMAGHYAYILVFIIALPLFSRFFLPRRYRWLERFALAFYTGTQLGVYIAGEVTVNLIGQVVASIKPLNSPDIMINFSRVLSFAAFFTLISYFFFTAGFGGKTGKTVASVFKVIGTPARYFMMTAFGAAWCNVYLGRVSQVTGAINFVLSNWLGLY
jgi:hypothetical protein